MISLNCSIINLGSDLTDLMETAFFKINLEKLNVRFDVFSVDLIYENKYNLILSKEHSQ
jgi:hypothetical protein